MKISSRERLAAFKAGLVGIGIEVDPLLLAGLLRGGPQGPFALSRHIPRSCIRALKKGAAVGARLLLAMAAYDAAYEAAYDADDDDGDDVVDVYEAAVQSAAAELKKALNAWQRKEKRDGLVPLPL